MMDLGSCSKCRKSIPAGTREHLGGLCLECLRCFLWEKDEETVPAGGGPTSPPDEILPLEIGSTFQGLKVLELVARGGMGVVYKARQPDLERVVALKVLSPELAKDPEFAQRFNGEAKVLALLAHPNIVQVFDFGRASDLYYLVMEFVEGSSLRQLLRKGPIPGGLALRILSQVCTALDYAHRQGVVHRDIKPENILIDEEGHAKIADFGLAKIMPGAGSSDAVTQTRVVMGTPRYMAPEQSGNPKAVDHRSDIYALGVVLYEMLTGVLPLGHFAPPSTKSPVDRRVDGIVIRALEAEPERRYQKVSELKTDLEAVSAGPGGPVPSGARRMRAIALGAALLALVGILGIGWKLLRKAPPPEAPLTSRPVKVREWQWENSGPGTRMDGADVVLTPSDNKRLSEAIPVGSILGKKFRLHFQFRYLLDPGQEPWFFLIMEASPASSHERNALVIFPEAGHTIHFASRQPGRGWGMREWDSLPPAAHGQDRWFDVDVFWDDASKRLQVTFDGKLVFNQQLGPKDTLHGGWSFGLGGTTKEFRIRDTWIENGP